MQGMLAGGPWRVKAAAAGRSSSSLILEEAGGGTALRGRLDPYTVRENRVFLQGLSTTWQDSSSGMSIWRGSFIQPQVEVDAEAAPKGLKGWARV